MTINRLLLIIIMLANTSFADDSSNIIQVIHEVDESLVLINNSEKTGVSKISLEIIGDNNVSRNNVDLVLVMDSSNSMAEPYLSKVKTAMAKLIDGMESSKDKIGFVSFNRSLGPSIEPTYNFTDIYNVINTTRFSGKNNSGSTCLGIGLKNAIDMLDKQRDASLKVIVFISDGDNSTCVDLDQPCEYSATARDHGIIIYPIDINESRNEASYMSCMATATGGSYYSANISQLDKIYVNLSNNIPRILGKDIYLNYSISPGLVISDLQSPGIIRKNKESNSFQVRIGTLSVGEVKKLSFTISGNESGKYYLGLLCRMIIIVLISYQ